MPSPYERLAVPRVINAAGTLTRLGGSLMDAAVTDAMAEAAQSFVPLDQLQSAVGRQIATATGAAAAIVTAGAAAGLTLAAAACLARDDFARMELLPDTHGMPHEVIIPRSHRNAYDHALRAAGARLIEVGLAERTRDPQPWEIDAAINERTVAIAFCVGFSPLPLGDVIEVARQHQLPVIVDASAALPPKANLRAFIAQGADLVVFSGGKAIRGPQSTGLLCGRRDLIASAALQMWDLDYLPELWNPPRDLIDEQIVRRGVPNHGLGRGMKVGKEEIVGLSVALERFLAWDENAEIARLTNVVDELIVSLGQLPGVEIARVERPDLWPQVELRVCASTARLSAVELVRQLEAGQKPIAVMQAAADRGRVGIDPFCLQPGEEEILARRLRELLIG